MNKSESKTNAQSRLLSSADRIYLALREDLLSGRLAFGERIVEERLAERFSTSRTPVREALRRLEGDGHLERLGSALRQVPPRLIDMTELYDLRFAVEQLIAERAARRGDRNALATLRDEWRTMEMPADEPAFVRTDEGFHTAFAAAAGNLAALRALRDINERIRVVRVHDFTSTDRIETTITEHVEIVEAALRGEPQRCSQLMSTHIGRSAEVVEQRVGQLLTKIFDADRGT